MNRHSFLPAVLFFCAFLSQRVTASVPELYRFSQDKIQIVSFNIPAPDSWPLNRRKQILPLEFSLIQIGTQDAPADKLEPILFLQKTFRAGLCAPLDMSPEGNKLLNISHMKMQRRYVNVSGTVCVPLSETSIPTKYGWFLPVGTMEVSRDQYAAVMGMPIPENGKGREPQTNITYSETLAFIARLNELLDSDLAQKWKEARLSDSFHFRLPTEAEWEYAARGGSVNPDFDRDYPLEESRISDYENIHTGSGSGVAYVNIESRKRPNCLGLFHMLGNVSEWVDDLFRLNYLDGHSGGRLARGGSYSSPSSSLTPAYRIDTQANGKSPQIGFRLVIGSNFLSGLSLNKFEGDFIAEYLRQRQPDTNVVTKHTETQYAKSLAESARNLREQAIQITQLERETQQKDRELISTRSKMKELEVSLRAIQQEDNPSKNDSLEEYKRKINHQQQQLARQNETIRTLKERISEVSEHSSQSEPVITPSVSLPSPSIEEITSLRQENRTMQAQLNSTSHLNQLLTELRDKEKVLNIRLASSYVHILYNDWNNAFDNYLKSRICDEELVQLERTSGTTAAFLSAKQARMDVLKRNKTQAESNLERLFSRWEKTASLALEQPGTDFTEALRECATELVCLDKELIEQENHGKVVVPTQYNGPVMISLVKLLSSRKTGGNQLTFRKWREALENLYYQYPLKHSDKANLLQDFDPSEPL